MNWLDGWLVGCWKVNKCVGLLAGWFVNLLVCWFVGWFVSWLVGWLACWLAGWLVRLRVCLLVNM